MTPQERPEAQPIKRGLNRMRRYPLAVGTPRFGIASRRIPKKTYFL